MVLQKMNDVLGFVMRVLVVIATAWIAWRKHLRGETSLIAFGNGDFWDVLHELASHLDCPYRSTPWHQYLSDLYWQEIMPF